MKIITAWQNNIQIVKNAVDIKEISKGFSPLEISLISTAFFTICILFCHAVIIFISIPLTFLHKGFSPDKKYIITSANNDKYLLRTGDIKEYERKKIEISPVRNKYLSLFALVIIYFLSGEKPLEISLISTVTSANNDKYLLRTGDIKEYERKKIEFQILNEMQKHKPSSANKPISIGFCACTLRFCISFKI
jgi:hypothetical protein